MERQLQGTVSAFDDASGAGAVLLDDGTELRFGGEAWADTGLRLLRVGQRVKVDLGPGGGTTPGGTVQRVQILTLP